MKSFKVYWSSPAIKDLNKIIEYISQRDNKSSARRIYNKIKSKAKNIKSFPAKGRIVPELKLNNIKNYREQIATPWRIIYRIEKEVVHIIAVFDGRRDLEDILFKRLIENK